jgi:hypothetical protein
MTYLEIVEKRIKVLKWQIQYHETQGSYDEKYHFLKKTLSEYEEVLEKLKANSNGGK